MNTRRRLCFPNGHRKWVVMSRYALAERICAIPFGDYRAGWYLLAGHEIDAAKSLEQFGLVELRDRKANIAADGKTQLDRGGVSARWRADVERPIFRAHLKRTLTWVEGQLVGLSAQQLAYVEMLRKQGCANLYKAGNTMNRMVRALERRGVVSIAELGSKPGVKTVTLRVHVPETAVVRGSTT